MKTNATLIAGALLVASGVAGFLVQDFHYTRETTAAKLGGFELKVQEEKAIRIPPWLNAGAIAVGAVLLVLGARRR